MRKVVVKEPTFFFQFTNACSTVFEMNCRPNNTNSSFNETGGEANCKDFPISGTSALSLMPDEAKVLLVLLYVMIFFSGVAGNSVVCYVFGKKKKKLSGGDVFTLSLACADLLAAFFVPVLVIHEMVANLKWYLGAALCMMLPSVSLVTLAASAWSLVLIAADRYRIIIKPMEPRTSFKMKCIGIAFIWLLSVALALPYTFAHELHDDEYCLEDVTFLGTMEKNVYAIILLSFCWIVPLIIIVILYWLCTKHLRKCQLSNEVKQTTIRRIAENRRVIKIFFIIVTLFSICTLPYAVFKAVLHFLVTYDKESLIDHQILMVLDYGFLVLTAMNSSMNPLVYAKKQKDIRNFARHIWGKICCKSSSFGDKNNFFSQWSVNDGSITRSEVTRRRAIRAGCSSKYRNETVKTFNNEALERVEKL